MFRVEPSIFIVALLGENTNLLIRLSVCPKNVHNLGCYLHSRSSFQYKYIDTCMDSRKLSVTSDAIIASRAIIIYGNVSYPHANIYSIYAVFVFDFTDKSPDKVSHYCLRKLQNSIFSSFVDQVSTVGSLEAEDTPTSKHSQVY